VKGKDSCSSKTALSFMCEEGHLEIAKLLCDHSAELESVDNNGRTPLMLTTLHGHGQTASHLAWLGASLFVQDKDGITLIKTAKTAFQELSK
jgi:ankyrin repeat protein